MITVKEALEIILNTAKDFGIDNLPLSKANGRVLREDLLADRDFPPFHRVTMDGIAIQYDAFKNGTRSFPIEGIAAAGAPKLSLKNNAACLEVMTGSILPENVDTVIRYEDLEIENQTATIQVEELKQGQNIHKKGEDRAAGSLIVKAPKMISSAEIGVAATIGKAYLELGKLPNAIIISTGDELVDVDAIPLAHQIRRSNIHQVSAILADHQIPADTFHLDDEMDEILLRLTEIVDRYDVIILSGGVSKGKYDYLPEALDKLGVKKLFHRIKQRPGKPFWFGEHPNGSVVFALPGNPVSSFLCTQRYFLPWLRKSIGLAPAQQEFAMLQEEVHFKPELCYFLEVKTSYNDSGQVLAKPVKGNGSGDLANLVDADALIQLPSDKNHFEAGEVYPIFRYR